jgi:hypothetical protein
MIEDEELMLENDRGFDKVNRNMGQVLTKIDTLVTAASGNVMVYLCIFVILVVALLYKLTK